jgi:hypothetical protein
MEMPMRFRQTLGVCGVLALSACGGGGGTPVVPVSPIGYDVALSTVVLGNASLLSAAAGFFNADPFPDVAVGRGDGPVSILLGRGDGTFDQAAPVVAGLPGTQSSIVRTAFLNLDPFVDLVVVDDDAARAQTFLGNGDGTFDPVYAVPIDLTPTDTEDCQVGRLNADVFDDVVFVTPTGVHVYLGTGGGFITPTVASPYLGAQDIRSVHIGQADSFPGLDLVACSPPTGFVHILRGDGLGGFAMSPASPVSFLPDHPVQAAVLDVDGLDGPDLVGLTANPTGVRIYLGDGLTNFSLTPGSPLGVLGDLPRQAVLVRRPIPDRPDLMLVTFSGTNLQDIVLTLTRLRPNPAVPGAVLRSSESVPGVFILELAVFDINQDGREDLLLPYLAPTGLFQVRLGK